MHGGVGHGCTYLRRHGLAGSLVDYAHNVKNDTCSSHVNADLFSLATGADLGIDLPCNSWSLARRASLWSLMPHRLRSPDLLYVLPELEGRDLETAQIGNFQIRLAVRLIMLSMASGRSGYLENPATSRAWLVHKTLLSREIASEKCRIIVVDMCGHGTAFKKPIRPLIWGKYASRVRLTRCNGKRGLCGHPGSPHLQLTGV